MNFSFRARRSNQQLLLRRFTFASAPSGNRTRSASFKDSRRDYAPERELERRKDESGRRKNSSLTLPPSSLQQAPSGSRTRTSAMARQQAAATSWALKKHHTKLSKISLFVSKSTKPELNPHHLLTTDGHRSAALVDCR